MQECNYFINIKQTFILSSTEMKALLKNKNLIITNHYRKLIFEYFFYFGKEKIYMGCLDK